MALALALTSTSTSTLSAFAEHATPIPERVFNGRVYNDSAGELRAWASGAGFLAVPANSKTGNIDVDHVRVCDTWYKIQYDGWVRVYDDCKLSRLGTQCVADGPGKPCRR